MYIIQYNSRIWLISFSRLNIWTTSALAICSRAILDQHLVKHGTDYSANRFNICIAHNSLVLLGSVDYLFYKGKHRILWKETKWVR